MKKRKWESTMNKLLGVIFLFGMMGAVEGLAQKRGGRTDGPEGSEIGYGGYSRPTVGAFSIALDGGANISVKKLGEKKSPLYLGGTVSYWIKDWATVGVHVNYAFNTERLVALLGPVFRTDTWPLSFTLGFRAGIANDVKTRFAISPEIGADMLIVNDHLLIGFLAAWDLPIGEGATPSQIRIGLKLGWRF